MLQDSHTILAMIMTGWGHDGRLDFLFIKKNSMFGAWFSFWEKADSVKEELWDTNIRKSRTYMAKAPTLMGAIPLHPEVVTADHLSVTCCHGICSPHDCDLS